MAGRGSEPNQNHGTEPNGLRQEILAEESFKISVFWNVTPRSLVDWHRRLDWLTAATVYPADRCGRPFRHVGNFLLIIIIILIIPFMSAILFMFVFLFWAFDFYFLYSVFLYCLVYCLVYCLSFCI